MNLAILPNLTSLNYKANNNKQNSKQQSFGNCFEIAPKALGELADLKALQKRYANPTDSHLICAFKNSFFLERILSLFSRIDKNAVPVQNKPIKIAGIYYCPAKIKHVNDEYGMFAYEQEQTGRLIIKPKKGSTLKIDCDSSDDTIKRQFSNFIVSHSNQGNSVRCFHLSENAKHQLKSLEDLREEYKYSLNPMFERPFENIGFLEKAFAIFKDINENMLPPSKPIEISGFHYRPARIEHVEGPISYNQQVPGKFTIVPKNDDAITFDCGLSTEQIREKIIQFVQNRPNA